MSPEAQRIAIAEACGWSYDEYNLCGPWRRGSIHDGTLQTAKQAPNYLNDLNAMHEAEKVFTNPHTDRRIRQLYRNWLHRLNRGQVWRATAAQRAEAFLRTLNLYTE